jgi:hypothetical protein
MARKSSKPAPGPSLPPAHPAPFVPSPPAALPWLATLDRRYVYATHIDPSPPQLKRTTFAVPVLLNLLFVAAIAWRAAHAVPFYASLARSALAGDVTTIPFLSGGYASWRAFALGELRHFAVFVLDWVLVTVVAPWPVSFFVERPANPVAWRWAVRFRPRELVVRVSRRWGAEELVRGAKKGEESPWWATRVLPAVAMDRLIKTGYVLMDKDWDLDFKAMIDGQAGIGDKWQEGDLNGKVWVFDGEWLVWDFAKELYNAVESSMPTAPDDVSGSEEEDGKAMMARCHRKLTEMGKEDLFYRWVELLQFESTRPGGFTAERQAAAGDKIKALFEEHGLDIEEFESVINADNETTKT